MVTIKNVAKRANVSIATVSRIINGQAGYTEKTMKRVLKAIEELGYTRNALARGWSAANPIPSRCSSLR